MDSSDFIKYIECDANGRFIKRESKHLEFKENFNIGAIIQGELSKTFAAFANAAGGVIIFGVKDKPRRAVGLSNNNFEELKEEKLAEHLNNQFSPEILFEIYSFSHQNMNFGAIIISKSESKPIICIKEVKKNKEGDIFYRYFGRSEKIKHAELLAILDEIKQLEQKKWMEHIQNIARIGPQNITLMDMYRGEIPLPNNKTMLIDSKLLKDIKFINSGHFVEKDGSPAIMLMGKVQGVETAIPNFSLEEDFYTATELCEHLNLLSPRGSPYLLTAIIWKFELQKNNKFFQTKGSQKFYSKTCLEFLKEKNITLDDAMDMRKEYQDRQR